MNHIRFIPLALCLCLLSFLPSCANNTNKPSSSIKVIRIPFAPQSKFLPQPSITDAPSILDLSQDHIADLESYFYAKKNLSTPANKRLSNYLENYVENYFYFNQTLTARESLDNSKGNCLSLAILTTAFAEHLDIDVGYQLVDSTPVYQEENGIVLSSEHVRSLLYAPKPKVESGIFFFNRSAIAIDYFPERNIRVRKHLNKNEFYAMYYRNRAAESIVEKDNVLAYWLLRKALDFNPQDHHAINMLALVHEYHGLKTYAEALYKYGIKTSEDKLNLLRNYKIYLQRERRFKDANKIANQLASYKTKNPFDWVKLGNNSLAQGKHSEAKSYFRRALKLAPYVHQAHFGIAKVEYQLGNRKAAKKALEKAKEKSIKLKNKELYQNKLIALAQQMKNNT